MPMYYIRAIELCGKRKVRFGKDAYALAMLEVGASQDEVTLTLLCADESQSRITAYLLIDRVRGSVEKSMSRCPQNGQVNAASRHLVPPGRRTTR
jgi:hypothetical protein